LTNRFVAKRNILNIGVWETIYEYGALPYIENLLLETYN